MMTIPTAADDSRRLVVLLAQLEHGPTCPVGPNGRLDGICDCGLRESQAIAGRLAPKRKGGVNRTSVKRLDRLAADPRIEEVWHETENGYFAELKDGYEADGCGSIRADTAAGLFEEMAAVRPGIRF